MQLSANLPNCVHSEVVKMSSNDDGTTIIRTALGDISNRVDVQLGPIRKQKDVSKAQHLCSDQEYVNNKTESEQIAKTPIVLIKVNKSDEDGLTPCGIHKHPKGVIQIDLCNFSNSLQCGQYATCAHIYFVQNEKLYMGDSKYMKRQTEVTPKMRMILIDWLIDIHNQFKLVTESLFLSVNILDRFLGIHIVSMKQLQLIGISCLWIAAKYEGREYPSVDELSSVTNGACTSLQIIRTEACILNTLNFTITVPYSVTFARRLFKVCNAVLGVNFDHLHENLTLFILNLCLQSYDMVGYRPSIIAASATHLAASICGREFRWDKNFEFYSGGWSINDLQHCREVMKSDFIEYFNPDLMTKTDAIKRKFQSRKYGCISTIVKDYVSYK